MPDDSSPLPAQASSPREKHQKTCQSPSTSGGPHLLFPTFMVSIKIRKTPSSSARRQSVLNFGFSTHEHFVDLVSFYRSPMFTAAWLSTATNNLSLSITLRRRFSSKPGTIIQNGLSPPLGWFARSLSAACARNLSSSSPEDERFRPSASAPGRHGLHVFTL